jgi:hypothetical protein
MAGVTVTEDPPGEDGRVCFLGKVAEPGQEYRLGQRPGATGRHELADAL